MVFTLGNILQSLKVLKLDRNRAFLELHSRKLEDLSRIQVPLSMDELGLGLLFRFGGSGHGSHHCRREFNFLELNANHINPVLVGLLINDAGDFIVYLVPVHQNLA